MTENEPTNVMYYEPLSYPWIVVTNYHKVSVICQGCGTTHHGHWNKRSSNRVKGIGSYDRNFQKPLCCNKLNGNNIKISYNNYGKFWDMKKNSKIEANTYEGFLMESFLQKYELKSKFINANWKWGSLDAKTKLWNGGVGNVSNIIWYECNKYFCS